MIKLPREVNTIMRSIEEKGFECYAVGGCVRDSLLGENPVDWDLATNATLDDMKMLFPEAAVISEKYAVVRLDYTGNDQENGIIVDISAMRIDGTCSESGNSGDVEFTNDILKDMERRKFTIDAMADNPNKPLVDPYEGREDLKKKLVRTVGDADKRCKEDPLIILRAIRFAAELGFDLHKTTYEAILNNAELLQDVSVDGIREEFIRIIGGPSAGKGLKMLVACGLLPYIMGKNTCKSISRREVSDLEGLAAGIDKTQCVESRRLGLFYCCFGKNKATEAIEYLNYDNETKQHLLDAINLMQILYFMSDKEEFKDFLANYGWNRYEYVHNLSKAYAIVYETPTTKIKSRIHMYKEIIANKEPIYIEDLAIDGNDLIEAGIADGEDAGKILLMLTDIVHRKPKENNKEDLLKHARKISKSKAAAALRKVKWLR